MSLHTTKCPHDLEQICAIENALSSLYDSDTYAALKSPETGLYSQSPIYIYDYLNDEIPL